jgi:hypothetical protein
MAAAALWGFFAKMRLGMTHLDEAITPARGACHDMQRTIDDLCTANAGGLCFSTTVHERHSQLQDIIQKKDQPAINFLHESTGFAR